VGGGWTPPPRPTLRRLVDTLVTGVVVALRGMVLDTGELAVNDVCVPGLFLPAAVSGEPRQ